MKWLTLLHILLWEAIALARLTPKRRWWEKIIDAKMRSSKEKSRGFNVLRPLRALDRG